MKHFWIVPAAMMASVAMAQNPPASRALPDASVLIGDLVDANRILARQGVLDGLGHISARSPTNPDHFYMARAVAPGSVKIADIAEFDLDGNPLTPGPRPYAERFIHAEIYRKRPDVNAIVHSHSPAVIPFSVSDKPLRPVQHTASFLGASVPVFEIRSVEPLRTMLVTTPVAGKALADKLGTHAVILMRGHGDVVVASSIPGVVERAVFTERNATAELQALMLGGTIRYLGPEDDDPANSTVPVGRAWDGWRDDLKRDEPPSH